MSGHFGTLCIEGLNHISTETGSELFHIHSWSETTIYNSVPNDLPKIKLKYCFKDATLSIFIIIISTLTYFKPMFRIYTPMQTSENQKFSRRWNIDLKWVYLWFLVITLNRSVCYPLQEVIGQNQTGYPNILGAQHFRPTCTFFIT